jgi:hypothetical protein
MKKSSILPLFTPNNRPDEVDNWKAAIACGLINKATHAVR